MKPRPARCRQFYSLYQLLIVFILLKDIAAQPVPYRRPPPPHLVADNWQQHPVDHHHPPQIHLPPPPKGCIQSVVEPAQPKTPQPVFFPYTVPIPWPTPFDGTHYAPAPSVPRAKLPESQPLSDDAYPLYIPCPQFEYVPLYYNDYNPAPKPRPAVKQLQPTRPVPDDHPVQITPPTQPPPTQPPPKIPVSQPPQKPEQKPLDPVCEDFPPLQGAVPPPMHTWVPPPENLPDYIPPPPSVLHTRSPGSHHGKKRKSHHSTKHGSRHSSRHGSRHNTNHGTNHNTNHGTNHNTRPYVAFSEPAPVAGNTPDSYAYYYHEPIPFAPYNPYGNTRTTYYDLYNPRRVDKTPVVNYGSEFVTYTEPSRPGATDDFYTYGPNIMTYIEDAPVPNYPPPRPIPAQTSYQPNPPRPYSWEYSTEPTYWDTQYYRAPPSPKPVSIGGRSSAFFTQDDTQFEYYEPETFTLVDNDNSQYVYNPYPAPTPTKQPPVTIGGRSSIAAPPPPPKQEEEAVGYVVYEPEYFDIVDTDNGEQTIVYGPNVIRVNEDADYVAGDKQVKRDTNKRNSGFFTLTTPEEQELLGNTPYVPQPLDKQPSPTSYVDLITNPETKTIS